MQQIKEGSSAKKSQYSTCIFAWIICVALFTVFGCRQDEGTNFRQNAEVRLIITDSIRFEASGDYIRFIAHLNNKFLAVNSSKNKIYILNNNGKTEKLIAIQGPGPLQYSKMIKCGFISSDQIAVVDNNKILFYNLIDDSITTCKYEKEEMLALPSSIRLFPLPKEQFVIASSAFDLSPSEMSYFDNLHTFSILEEDCTNHNKGGYTPESIYRQDLFPALFEPTIYVPNSGTDIFQIFPLDKKIYRYGGEQFELLETIAIEPNEFGEVVNRQDDSMESMMYLLQKNSVFRNLVVNDSYILMYYIKGLSDDDVAASLASYNEKARVLRKKLFSLYDLKGNKIGADFEDDKVSVLLDFDEEQNLLFQANTDDNNNIIYKARIEVR